jgi:hypothetical protein|tara:strand:- start:434 stop:814 length:381 start_codon:yes stop_codon:yes gene_type:complete
MKYFFAFVCFVVSVEFVNANAKALSVGDVFSCQMEAFVQWDWEKTKLTGYQKERFKFSITDQNTVKFEEASYFENLALNISYIGYKILALNSEDGNIVAKLKDDKFSIVAISYDASDFITAKCERL